MKQLNILLVVLLVISVAGNIFLLRSTRRTSKEISEVNIKATALAEDVKKLNIEATALAEDVKKLNSELKVAIEGKIDVAKAVQEQGRAELEAIRKLAESEQAEGTLKVVDNFLENRAARFMNMYRRMLTPRSPRDIPPRIDKMERQRKLEMLKQRNRGRDANSPS